MRILLVEDNPDDVKMTLRAMKKCGLDVKVDVAEDGARALELVEKTAPKGWPHLILLDLKLPRLSGLDVLRQLKADPSTRNIPVVMLTSSDEEIDLRSAYMLGANSYLQKPVEYEKFIEMVRHVGLYWLELNVPPPPIDFPSSQKHAFQAE